MTAGDAAQPALAPGQMLVSRAGAVWRWDGYTIRAGTPTAAAVRLQQRNRLRKLRAALAEAEHAAAEAEAVPRRSRRQPKPPRCRTNSAPARPVGPPSSPSSSFAPRARA